MGKSPTAFECPEISDAVRERQWADAETRAFLERPDHSAPFGKALRVILIAAMVASAVKIACLLVVHA